VCGLWAGVMKTGQVFVSHTSDMAGVPEGRSFVQAALDAVGRAGMASVDMRYFAAGDGRPADYCRARVRECEIFVAVIGFRYGSLAPGEAVSYTELEFDAASGAGLPRLVFLLEPGGWRLELADADRGPVDRFRQRVRDAGLVARAFTSSDGLELEVFHALSELARGRPEGRRRRAGQPVAWRQRRGLCRAISPRSPAASPRCGSSRMRWALAGSLAFTRSGGWRGSGRPPSRCTPRISSRQSSPMARSSCRCMRTRPGSGRWIRRTR
jgi:hypothetical protein